MREFTIEEILKATGGSLLEVGNPGADCYLGICLIYLLVIAIP